MTADEFVNWWQGRDRSELDDLVRMLDRGATADDTVARVRAAAALSARPGRPGRRRDGCRVVHEAGAAALDACARTGLLQFDRDASTRLARAASDACLGLVSGAEADLVDELLRPFRIAMTTGR